MHNLQDWFLHSGGGSFPWGRSVMSQPCLFFLLFTSAGSFFSSSPSNVLAVAVAVFTIITLACWQHFLHLHWWPIWPTKHEQNLNVVCQKEGEDASVCGVERLYLVCVGYSWDMSLQSTGDWAISCRSFLYPPASHMLWWHWLCCLQGFPCHLLCLELEATSVLTLDFWVKGYVLQVILCVRPH